MPIPYLKLNTCIFVRVARQEIVCTMIIPGVNNYCLIAKIKNEYYWSMVIFSLVVLYVWGYDLDKINTISGLTLMRFSSNV